VTAVRADLAGPDSNDDDAFLGVVRSAGGKRWRLRDGDARAGMMLAQQLGLPEIVGRIMAARGIDVGMAGAWLNPTLRDQLPDPSRLADMDRAAERLAAAVAGAEPIAIFGDYDVDGATSSALLARFFAAIGVPVRVYIPDRLREGYGPNAPALLRLRAEGIRLVVTVDCGVNAFEPLAEAQAAGLDVVVVDHHAAEPRLPDAVAVVNPNRLDDTSGQGMLAAVGVSFLIAVALNRRLRETGWYKETGRREPDLLALLDLVALGTVADVVPLAGLNRALVVQGLKVMARRANPGLAALADVARLDEKPTAFHAGYMLGPRVNAGGRVGEAGLGARLLMTNDTGEAAKLAQTLDGYNTERRDIEARVLEEAIAQVEAAHPGGAPGSFVLAASEGWHAGVIGIVAARLKERFNRPALVIALEDGVGKGSGRSIEGVDLGAAVIAARQQGILVNGGGHRMAAGLTVEAGKLDDLRAFLAERIGRAIADGAIVPTLNLDGALAVGGATPELVETLDRLAPFGAGNPEPRFAIRAARVAKADVVGADHVRVMLAGEGGGRLKAIAFRAVGQPLGEMLLNTAGQPLHIAGKLRADTWQGRAGVQLVIDDAAVAG
jgi:single-stranded-DNA-specific exonuclease